MFLSLIEDHKIELQIDSILESNILYIEALDAKGKPLWEKSTFKSKSNIKSQEKYLRQHTPASWLLLDVFILS